MSERGGHSLEEGFLFHFRQERQKAGNPLVGKYVIVNLDNGSLIQATLNDTDSLDLEPPIHSWQGEAILPRLLQSLGGLLNTDCDTCKSILLDGTAMDKCRSTSEYAIALEDEDFTCLELGEYKATFRQLNEGISDLSNAIQAFAKHAHDFLDDEKEDEGRLILYGASAGFSPLQYMLRQCFRGDDLYRVDIPDPFFQFEPDNGTAAQAGLDQLTEQIARNKRVPADIVLQLIARGQNGSCNKMSCRLAEKGQSLEQLAANPFSFFAAPGAKLSVFIDGDEKTVTIPGTFLNEAKVITAQLQLNQGQISLLLRDQDRKATCDLKMN